MIPEIGIITVIGLGLMVLLYVAKWWYNYNDKIEKEEKEIDKEIDNANDASDIMRTSGKLRDKK